MESVWIPKLLVQRVETRPLDAIWPTTEIGQNVEQKETKVTKEESERVNWHGSCLVNCERNAIH